MAEIAEHGSNNQNADNIPAIQSPDLIMSEFAGRVRSQWNRYPIKQVVEEERECSSSNDDYDRGSIVVPPMSSRRQQRS